MDEPRPPRCHTNVPQLPKVLPLSPVPRKRGTPGRGTLVGDAGFCVSLLAGQGSSLAPQVNFTAPVTTTRATRNHSVHLFSRNRKPRCVSRESSRRNRDFALPPESGDELHESSRTSPTRLQFPNTEKGNAQSHSYYPPPHARMYGVRASRRRRCFPRRCSSLLHSLGVIE
jgi:hypothetical protein